MAKSVKLGSEELKIWKEIFKEAAADPDFKIITHESIDWGKSDSYSVNISIIQNNDYRTIKRAKRKVGA